MTQPSEAGEFLRILFVLIVWLWPYVRGVFLVWAILNATASLRRIATSLERVARRGDVGREASGTGLKPWGVNSEALA